MTSLPASILEKSRMSLMTVSRASPDVRTISVYSRCSAVRPVSSSRAGHADDAVHRRADFVAHVGQKLALGTVGGFRALLGAPPLSHFHAKLRRALLHAFGKLLLMLAQSAHLPTMHTVPAKTTSAAHNR